MGNVAYRHNGLEGLGDREAFVPELLRLLEHGGRAVIADCDPDEY